MTRYTIKDDTHYWGWPTSIVTGKSGAWWVGATHANNHFVTSGKAYAIKSTNSGHTWGSDVLVDGEPGIWWEQNRSKYRRRNRFIKG